MKKNSLLYGTAVALPALPPFRSSARLARPARQLFRPTNPSDQVRVRAYDMTADRELAHLDREGNGFAREGTRGEHRPVHAHSVGHHKLAVKALKGA